MLIRSMLLLKIHLWMKLIRLILSTWLIFFMIVIVLIAGGCLTRAIWGEDAPNDPTAYDPLTLEPKKPEGFFNKVKQLIFAKEDVSAELIIPYILKPSDVLDLTTSSIHKVPHTSCITKVRGALQDCAKSNYVGKIIIEK